MMNLTAPESTASCELDGTALQDADGHGTGSIDVAYEIATGAAFEKTTNIPFVLLTKDNVDQFLKPNSFKSNI